MYEVGLLDSGKSTDYAAGLSVYESGGLRWVTHGGSWVGYRSSLVRVPGEHLSVIALCNRADANAGSYASRIARLLLADKLGPAEADADDEEPEPKPVAAQWDPGDLSRYAGAYYGEEADARCVLDQRGARLVLEGCARGEVLKPGKPGEFVTDGGSPVLRFAPGSADVDGFIYWSPGLRGLPFRKIKESFE
jgi:hypothetical protein